MGETSIRQLVGNNYGGSIDDMSTVAQTLFGLLVLIVDIKYRVKYGETFDDQRGRGYSKNEQFKEVLADQASPVNNGLLGY